MHGAIFPLHLFKVLRLPRKNLHACQRFWNCYKTRTSCSLSCACHAKQRLNVQKWSPNPLNFNTFDLEICFAPQPHALFEHHDAARQSFTLLTSTCASHHNGVHFFISHLARWLRTRCFSEPTSRPSTATNHWINTVNRDFSTFSRTCIFFLLTISLRWSSFFFACFLYLFPPLLFFCPYCWKFAF